MEYENLSEVDAGEPKATDPLTEQETQISEERLQKLGEALASKRDEWVAAKQAGGIEKRWLDDYDQYMGRDEASKQVASMMDSAQQGFPVLNKQGQAQRSTVFLNITRPKTLTALSRVANMLLPTDDRNFGLKPSPTPELSKATELLAKIKGGSPTALGEAMAHPSSAPPTGMMGPPQQPPPGAPPEAAAPAMPPGPAGPPPVDGGAQAAVPSPVPSAPSVPSHVQMAIEKHEQTLKVAADAAKAMQDEVDGQFQACKWNSETRSMLHDAAILGSGVLKGPIVVSRVSKTWQPLSDGKATVHTLEISRELAPASYRVSPWNIYTDPSCGADFRAGSGLFETYDYTTKQMRELVKQPGFLKDQIAKVLLEGPASDTKKNELERRTATAKKEAFKVWEYWGEFTPEDMRAAGVDVQDDSTDMVSGCVILVNSTVIKGFLNPLDTGDIPFDIFPWEQDDESPWGYGVPHMCKHAQKVINAAWRQLMDNSGNSMGPQIVLKPGIVQPADGQWIITGNKLWNCLDDSVDVRTAFASVDIQNHAVELENIIKLAQAFADEESLVPQIAAGEKGNAPDTVGGMTILQNSVNVVLGRIAKSFDDKLIAPHVSRYVDWNMAYSDKSEIKGDHLVQPRGTSALLVRDIQNQTLIQFGQFQASGVISPMVNWEAWIKAVLKAQHVEPAEILKSDQEIAALANQPPPPPIQLQVAQVRAQAAQAVAQTNAQGQAAVAQQKFQAEMAAQQQELQADQQRLQSGELTPHAASATARIQTAQIQAASKAAIEQSRAQTELAYAQAEAGMAHDNNVAKLQQLQLQRDLAILQYAQAHSLTLQQIQADLAKTQMQETTKRQLGAVELQLKANEGAASKLHENISNEPAMPIA